MKATHYDTLITMRFSIISCDVWAPRPTHPSMPMMLLPRRFKSETSVDGTTTKDAQPLDDFRCTLCYKSLCEPVTFGCGLSRCEVCRSASESHARTGSDENERAPCTPAIARRSARLDQIAGPRRRRLPPPCWRGLARCWACCARLRGSFGRSVSVWIGAAVFAELAWGVPPRPVTHSRV